MTLTFFSNFLNHHQLPFCLAMQKALGSGFTFVATTPFNAGAVSVGYRDMNLDYDFCLPAYLDGEKAAKARKLGAESDVVLSGGVADSWYAPRLAANKLTFRVSERPLKPLYASLSNPATAAALWWRNGRYKNRSLYLLACGAHAAADFARVGAYRGKAYSWGYFPPVPDALERSWNTDLAAPVRLLWAGRMISWKRPQQALALAGRLWEEKLPFTLRFVGQGELLEGLKAAAAAAPWGRQVEFAGSLSPEGVRQEMERADIFLFTSDGNEGWGAVLNEAMAAGCAVVASSQAGATGFLVRPGENGLCYRRQETLLEAGVRLAQAPGERQRLGRAAFETMRATWNGPEAARRLLALCQGLLSGAPPVFESGPCSRAEL